MSGRILIGDALAELRKQPDESVNCVVTSPPYWGLRNYGVDGQLGLEATPAEYVSKMVEVFREVRRVLRLDGVLWLNLGDCYATGAGRVGEHPGGGAQGARWKGEIDRPRDDKRGYRGERLANGRGDHPAVLRVKTRALRDGSHAGKHTAMAAMGPMTQPNRMPIEGLKPKDLVGIPWRLAFALQADGWWLRSDVVWAKQNPMPESVTDRPTKAHEYLFLLAKSERYHYDAAAIREPQTAPEASTSEDVARAFSRRRATVSEPSQPDLEASEIGRKRSGNKERAWRHENGGVAEHSSHQAFGVPWVDKDGLRNKRSVWTIPTQPNPEAHFATFPEALVTPCVLAGCPAGGVVLDPFGGTGTVARVAEDLGRHWLLIELNPEYAAMAERRMRQRGLLGLIDSPPAPPNASPAHESEPSPDGVSLAPDHVPGTHFGEGGVGDLSYLTAAVRGDGCAQSDILDETGAGLAPGAAARETDCASGTEGTTHVGARAQRGESVAAPAAVKSSKPKAPPKRISILLVGADGSEKEATP